MENSIIIKGAREHNLKNISVNLPRHKLVVFTGLSGSGKSSLAFDTIFAEGQRRYVESLSAYARQFLGQMPKPDVDEISGLSPAISIDQKAHSSNPRSTVATITEIYDYLRVLFARVGSPHCTVCHKEITKMTSDEIATQIYSHVKNETENGKVVTIMASVVRGRKGEYHQMLYDLYNAGFMKVRVDGKVRALKNRLVLERNTQHDIDLIVDELSAILLARQSDASRLLEAIEMAISKSQGTVTVLFPDGKEITYSTKFSCAEHDFAFPEIEPRLFSFNSPYGQCASCMGLGTAELFSDEVCGDCHGARLRKESLEVTIGGKNIVGVTSLSIVQAVQFFMDLIPGKKSGVLNETQYTIASTVLREIIDRLTFMMDVGLHYITLSRTAGTLSGGEAQRIRLASQIGSKLTGTLYVLDEPTIGLHQRDNEKLIKTLLELRDLGNSIIVVEHDEDTILASDFLLDIGPGAGIHGGNVVAVGETKKLLAGKNKEQSLTIEYLQKKKFIEIPKYRSVENVPWMKVKNARANNLKNITVEIPLKRFVCITGVSGSGKSTLVHDIIFASVNAKLQRTRAKVEGVEEVLGTEYLDKIILMDQGSIGRTPRSNPATYTGVFGHIRDLFALTADARVKGYKPGRFSFNVPRQRGGGRCDHCEGNGQLAIEMHFLPTVFVQCDVCHGKRFDTETLAVHFSGKSIYEVLKMTIEEARDFFKDIPVIADVMNILNEVGLGYLELGQSATTLSGGEAQRIKLSFELSKRQTGKTLYVLDEPTVGLHYEDVRKLLHVVQRLVERGNSVLMIEHNLDVIKCSDYVIDLGPEGGDNGGEIIATGTPLQVSKKKGSYTGLYLKKVLGN